MTDAACDPQDIIDQFAHDRYAALSDIRIVEVRPGYCRTELDIAQKHLNSVNTLHGGAFFTLADVAFAAASNATGRVAVAINVSINFIKAATEGRVTAEAVMLSENHRLSNFDVKVTDQAGQLLAVFHGLAYRKSQPSGRAVADMHQEPR